jgi:uncharacterized protein YuzE
MVQLDLKITYDPEIDAGYIRLVSYETDPEERLTTLSIEGRSINLDFNRNGELVGIETLAASDDFPEELLEKAEVLGDESRD